MNAPEAMPAAPRTTVFPPEATSSESPVATAPPELVEAAPRMMVAPPEADPSAEPAPHVTPSPEAEPLDDPAAGAAVPKPEPDDSPGDHTVVKVFYGTDRAADEADIGRLPWRIWLAATLCFGGAGMVLMGIGSGVWPSPGVRGVGKCVLLAALGLTAWTAYAGWTQLKAAQIARGNARYGPLRGEFVLGTCSVSIPKDHQVGRLEAPSILRFEFRPNPDRHVVLLDVRSQDADEFYRDLRACVGRSPRKEAFVFVHGYNVAFDDAVRRTAQIAYDLKFEGAPIFYSWPSQGQACRVHRRRDERRMDRAAPEAIPHRLAEQSGAEQVHLIAHSMGNRALTTALRYLWLRVAGAAAAVPRGGADRAGHRRRRVSPRHRAGHRQDGPSA